MGEAPDINVDELRRRARRRLIGAVVLALAAAVIVPMLLESEPKPLGEDVSVKIPPEDNARFVNGLSDKAGKNTTAATEPAAKKPGAKDSTAEAMRPAPAASASSAPATEPAPVAETPAANAPAALPSNVPAPKKSIAQAEQKMLGATSNASAPPVVASAAKPAKAPATAPIASAAPADAPKEGFSVQLAAFADDKGANSLANKLKRAAYPAYTEPLTTSKGTLWRVRVGPYPSRDDAVGVRDKLKGEGYSGIVSAAK
ncbi:MAG: SPOR domain-containing protein [Betaproteobacteria bacterium]